MLRASPTDINRLASQMRQLAAGNRVARLARQRNHEIGRRELQGDRFAWLIEPLEPLEPSNLSNLSNPRTSRTLGI